MASQLVIKAEKLTKRFGHFVAANELTFEVYPGKFSGFSEQTEPAKPQQ
jgi:ABC-2 type transport system ATP-binding protein